VSATVGDLSDDIAAAIEAIEQLASAPPDVKRAVCRDNYLAFANLVSHNWLDGAQTDWYPLPAQSHFDHWNRQVESSPLNILLAARKHTKTTFVLTKIMHKSEYREGHRSLYWANTENQVEERMEELEEMIDANPWLRHLHTDGALKSKSFESGAKLTTTWVTGAVEGGHVDLSIGDDPLKEFGDIPDERIEEWYGKVIYPMLNPDGLHVIVGTRKRPNDLYELLRTRDLEDLFDAPPASELPSYDLTEYPAIREPWLRKYGDRVDGNLAPAELYSRVEAPVLADALDVEGETLHVLWPEARDLPFLKRNLGAQGRPYFLREYCMVFVQVEDAIIERTAVDACTLDRTAPYRLEETANKWQQVVVGVDPAVADRGDLMALVTVGVKQDEDGVVRRHVPDVYVERGIAPSKFKRKLQGLHDRYRPNDIKIEANGFQQWIESAAVEFDQRLPVSSSNTDARKHSWMDGIPKIASDVERGLYRFYQPRNEQDAIEDLKDALVSLRMDEDDRLEGHTPDTVMALYQAEKALAEAGGARSYYGDGSEDAYRPPTSAATDGASSHYDTS